MSAPGPRSRGNGLVARAYVALVECDPRLADALLTALAQAGIAAYVAPSPGQVGGYLDVRLPGRPVDRVYVDASRRALAEQVMATELPHGAGIGAPDPQRPDPAPEVDFDAEFAQIVAAFGDGPTAPDNPPAPPPAQPPGAALPPAARRPADLPPTTRPPTARPADPPPARRPAPGASAQPAPGPRDWAPGPEDDDGHYIPPDPPPMPRTHPVTRWAWAALAIGLLLVLSPVVPALHASAAEQLVGIFAILGGVGTLVWRMRDGVDPDDPDDGAVV